MAGEAQREAMLTAIMARLEGDAELAGLATGGVHLVRAPQDADAAEPYVTVRVRPGGRLVDTIGRARAARFVNVEVLGRVRGAGTVTAERIDERIEALLADHSPSLPSPWSVILCRRIADVDLATIDDGVEFDQLGGLYQVGISGSAA